MKILRRVLVVTIASVSASSIAQELPSPYYVVIGAFKNEANAQKYCTYAEDQNLPAVYALNEERGVYYVYVRMTQTKSVAEDILARVKGSSNFRDAWVFNGKLAGNLPAPSVARQPAPSTTQRTDLPEQPITPEQPLTIEDPVQDAPADTSRSVEEQTQSAFVPPVTEAAVPAKPIGRPFVFKLMNAETGSMVNGLVRLQESEKANQFRGFNANEKVYVPAPANKSGKWIVVSHVLGYRQSKRPLVYEKAAEAEGATKGSDEELIIPIKLQRVKRGDYVEMPGVKFFHNSAIFTAESERELKELVAMLQENPDYHIRLHGHTNGKQARDIVSIGASGDLFKPDVSNAKFHTSAKELSLLRAELVKTYLINNGIDASRITTKGEGGAQMIYDPKGTLGPLNDRVEVEIRKH